MVEKGTVTIASQLHQACIAPFQIKKEDRHAVIALIDVYDHQDQSLLEAVQALSQPLERLCQYADDALQLKILHTAVTQVKQLLEGYSYLPTVCAKRLTPWLTCPLPDPCQKALVPLVTMVQSLPKEKDLPLVTPFLRACKHLPQAQQQVLSPLLARVGELMVVCQQHYQPLLQATLLAKLQNRFNQSIVIKEDKLKKVRRILEKSATEPDYDGHLTRVVDILRFTVTCGDVAHLLRVVRWMHDPYWLEQGIRVHRIKDRLQDPMPTTYYRDYSLILYVPIAKMYIEMQLTLAKLFDAKQALHTFYEKTRGPNCTGKVEEGYNRAAQASYSTAWANYQHEYSSLKEQFLPNPQAFYDQDATYQKPTYTRLTRWICQGDVVSLRTALRKGIDPAHNQRTPSLLEQALIHGQIEVAQLLLSVGAPQPATKPQEALLHSQPTPEAKVQ